MTQAIIAIVALAGALYFLIRRFTKKEKGCSACSHNEESLKV
jgi:hypothetical protein